MLVSESGDRAAGLSGFKFGRLGEPEGRDWALQLQKLLLLPPGPAGGLFALVRRRRQARRRGAGGPALVVHLDHDGVRVQRGTRRLGTGAQLAGGAGARAARVDGAGVWRPPPPHVTVPPGPGAVLVWSCRGWAGKFSGAQRVLLFGYRLMAVATLFTF